MKLSSLDLLQDNILLVYISLKLQVTLIYQMVLLLSDTEIHEDHQALTGYLKYQELQPCI